jgi:hypothetical protein
MPAYRFVNVWRLRAPIQDVFRIIDDVDAWPEWWPGVEAVERLGEAGADGLGASVRATFLGKLPYRLRFDLRITRRAPPTSLAGDATGELVGTGTWTLWEEPGWTGVRYVWAISTTRRWMNLLAPLPFVDEIFRLNHHAVMRRGLRGIRERLGGLEGTYQREA